MLILNFTHPLTPEHITQIESLASLSTKDIKTIPVQIDQSEPLEAQEWQTRPHLINPPGYAPVAFVLLAELHGRMGHFPTFIRLRPKADPITSFEVAELLNLQTVREHARTYR